MWGDEVVRLAATEPFFDAAKVIPVVAMAYALYGMSLITTTGMGVTKKTVGQGITVGVAALVNIGLNLALIPSFLGSTVAGSILGLFAINLLKRNEIIDF